MTVQAVSPLSDFTNLFTDIFSSICLIDKKESQKLAEGMAFNIAATAANSLGIKTDGKNENQIIADIVQQISDGKKLARIISQATMQIVKEWYEDIYGFLDETQHKKILERVTLSIKHV